MLTIPLTATQESISITHAVTTMSSPYFPVSSYQFNELPFNEEYIIALLIKYFSLEPKHTLG